MIEGVARQVNPVAALEDCGHLLLFEPTPLEEGGRSGSPRPPLEMAYSQALEGSEQKALAWIRELHDEGKSLRRTAEALNAPAVQPKGIHSSVLRLLAPAQDTN